MSNSMNYSERKPQKNNYISFEFNERHSKDAQKKRAVEKLRRERR